MAAAIACEACGKKFAWSPQFAGKKMKCKCGAAITIPLDAPIPAPARAAASKPAAPAAAKSSSSAKASRSAPPLPSRKAAPPPRVAPADERRIEAADDDGPILDIVEPVVAMSSGGAAVLACPSCNSALSPGAILCVGCGYNLQLRRKMIAAPTKVLGNDGMIADQTDTAFMVREKIAPPIIMVLGYLLWVSFMAAGWEAESSIAITGIAITVAIMTGFATVFMTGGCFIAAKLLDTNFGSLPTAVVKLAATYLLANGVTEMITYSLGGFGGIMIYTSVGYGIYWIMLMWLFELDGFEVWVTATIFFLLQIGAFFAFILLLVTVGFGAMAAGMGGGGMPMGGASDADYEMYDEDYDSDMMLDDGEGTQPEFGVPGAEDPNAVPAEPTDPATVPAVPQNEAAPIDGSSDAAGAWPWATEARELLAGPNLWDPWMEVQRYRIRIVTA